MREIFSLHGALPQQSCFYTLEQNGVAERNHRHILETARTLLTPACMPLNFWAEAVLTSTYLINRRPSNVLNGQTPYELLYLQQPSYEHLRIFGCTCFCVASPRLAKCAFLGFSQEHRGYRCYEPATGKLHKSRHATS